MKILVTGGAGYIGSFMVKRLIDENHEVVVVDSLERGHKEYIDTKATFIEGDLQDSKFVNSLFDTNVFDGVIHFAAYISMRESMEHPGMYFQNTVQPVLNLLETMVRRNCKSFIFSSTAGVYGNPTVIPIPEDHAKNPTNPYGESKYLVERILPWYQRIHGLNAVVLRYFNASGAALDGSMGEAHLHESHIIPNIMQCALSNQPFPLFGTDYKTEDGTCVRDYIHVIDLVEAHLLGLQKLKVQTGTFFYNVGAGKGYSNKQIIAMVEKVSGIKIEVTPQSRRPGDADILVADTTKISKELGFEAKHSELETIISSAWKWHKQNLQ